MNSQLQFFTSNCKQRLYNLLEVHQAYSHRGVKSCDCLLNTLKDEGTGLAKTAACSAIFGGKIPLSLRDLTDLVKSKIDSVSIHCCV